jgi:hypothetical protein
VIAESSTPMARQACGTPACDCASKSAMSVGQLHAARVCFVGRRKADCPRSSSRPSSVEFHEAAVADCAAHDGERINPSLEN